MFLEKLFLGSHSKIKFNLFRWSVCRIVRSKNIASKTKSKKTTIIRVQVKHDMSTARGGGALLDPSNHESWSDRRPNFNVLLFFPRNSKISFIFVTFEAHIIKFLKSLYLNFTNSSYYSSFLNFKLFTQFYFPESIKLMRATTSLQLLMMKWVALT